MEAPRGRSSRIVARLCAELGVSPGELAALLGRSQSSVYAWLAGEPAGALRDWLSRLQRIEVAGDVATITVRLPGWLPARSYAAAPAKRTTGPEQRSEPASRTRTTVTAG